VGEGVEVRAFSSKASIYRFATMGDTGEPIALIYHPDHQERERERESLSRQSNKFK
jgi:hypothetical protein